MAGHVLTSIDSSTVTVWHDTKLGALPCRAVALTQLRRRYLMDRELDREHKDRLRLLIETMQRAGRSERYIERAVLKASRRTKRDASRPSRRLVRFSRARLTLR